jgi:hypothetical protein
MTPALPKIKTAARVSPCWLAHSLRGWARGSDSTQAPVELLIRSFGGTFSQSEQPCIMVDRSGQIVFNAEVLTEGSVGDARRRAASAGRRRCPDGRREFARSCRALIALDLDHSALALLRSGDEPVGLYQLRATSQVTDRS